MSVVNSTPLLAAAGGEYQISRSVRLRSSASAYFNRTFSSGANETTSTLSLWVKRGKIGAQQTLMGVAGGGSNEADLFFDGGDTLTFASWNGGSRPLGTITTSAVFRDPSAWYHIVFIVDTTNATASNRLRLYVNGLLQTIGSSSYPSQNAVWYWNGAYAHRLGAYANTLGAYMDGYLTEINFIDGQALTPSSFGETDVLTGVWKPKKYAGTYGTNGFYLNFSDNSNNTAATIGKDYSGNGNNWTPNNISVTAGATYDSMIDVPTLYADGGNGRGNYAVMNPIRTSSAILTNGNLQVAQNTTAYVSSSSTMGMSSGKWYWEVTIVSASSQVLSLGITNSTSVNGITSGIWTYHLDGTKYIGASSSAYGSNYNTNGVVVGFAFDADAGTLTCYRNNVPQGTLVSGLAADTYFAYATLYNSGTVAFNFGQRHFAYTPPTGFKALNTQNLPEPVIKKGNQYFDAVTWTSLGSSTPQTISGTQFQPDLLWLKSRSFAEGNTLVDAVRGSSKTLTSFSTAAEGTATNFVSSINADGWSMGNSQFSAGAIVTWAWKASGSTVSNTDGSITSTVSANPTAGFSVVTYTGTGAAATVGHGLGVAPKMIIVKNRGNGGAHWFVYHSAMASPPQNYRLLLNTTGSVAGDPAAWNNTAPASSVFSVGSGVYTNENTVQHVAYCFSEVAGYSKFGSYTGNGSADGPFVFCGFKPKFVMIKNASISATWIMFDTERKTFNVNGQQLYPNLSDAEVTDNVNNCMDFLSNGFKFRGASAVGNGNGNTIIFMAFAEHPFKNALAR